MLISTDWVSIVMMWWRLCWLKDKRNFKISLKLHMKLWKLLSISCVLFYFLLNYLHDFQGILSTGVLIKDILSIFIFTILFLWFTLVYKVETSQQEIKSQNTFPAVRSKRSSPSHGSRITSLKKDLAHGFDKVWILAIK